MNKYLIRLNAFNSRPPFFLSEIHAATLKLADEGKIEIFRLHDGYMYQGSGVWTPIETLS